MHKAQIFSYLLISFLVGIFLAGVFDSKSLELGMILFGTIIVAATGYELDFSKTKKGKRKLKIGLVAGFCILAATAGIFRYQQANKNESVLLSLTQVQTGTSKGMSVSLRGVVDNEMTINGDKGQVVLHVYEASVSGNVIKVDEDTLLYVKASPVYQIGDKISVQGKLQVPTNFADGFDYVQYLKNKEIRTVVPYPKIVSDENLSVPTFQRLRTTIYRKIFDWKGEFENVVNASLSQPYAAYINGILLGSRQEIPADITQAFNNTSTTHVLAISGYNITIIAEALLAALVYFFKRRQAFWLSVAIIILFTIMTGAGASVIRAAVMGILLLAANGYGRLYNPKNSVLFAAAIMVFLDPLSLKYDVGFELSFLAVLGLMYVYPLLEFQFRDWPERFGLKETALLSISAQIMVAPLLAFVFHSFSLVSIPANVLVLPLMPYVMLFGFLTGLGGLILPALGKALGILAWLLSAYQLSVIRWLGGLSFSAINIVISVFGLCFLYLLIILAIWSLRILKPAEDSI